MKQIEPESVIVEVKRVNLAAFPEKNEQKKGEDQKAEIDVSEAPLKGAMQSFVGKKDNRRWLWHGINHQTGEILAYILGKRQDEVFLELKRLLKPFGITKFYTDGLKTYERHLSPDIRQVSKYKMQKIERKHSTLRTRIKRLARKTICFSKSTIMHDIVICLFINKSEFGLKI